jgi:ABC-type transporter MlaC component
MERLALLFTLLIFSNPLLLNAEPSTLRTTPTNALLIRVSNSDALDPHVLLEVIEGQLDALRKGNSSKAYTKFTSSEFRKITSQQQFQQFVKNFSVLSANRSVKFNSVNFEKSIATFEATLISQNGDTLDVEYDLVNENGKWKILGIQLFNPETTNIHPDQI